MDSKKFLAVFMIVFTVMASSFAFYFYQVLYTPNILVEREDQLFAISKEASFKQVQNDLYDLGIVNDLVSFSFLARLKQYDELIKPGMYLLKKDMSNNDAINLLRSGAQTPVKITFTMARKIEELPEKIASYVSFEPQEMATLLLQDSIAIKYGFTKETFISMFIPNTYEVYWTITPTAFLDKMFLEYEKFWNDERTKKAEQIGLTKQDVSTMASIVEGETKKMDEAPVVAGVYINRIKRGMPLQADPTLVFALGDFTIKRILNKDKLLDSPYNTYINKGLPPGPISMPSIGALNAVLNYQDHKYLYFCAKEDFSGYHSFATNLIDHNANARRLHAALNREKIFR